VAGKREKKMLTSERSKNKKKEGTDCAGTQVLQVVPEKEPKKSTTPSGEIVRKGGLRGVGEGHQSLFPKHQTGEAGQ